MNTRLLFASAVAIASSAGLANQAAATEVDVAGSIYWGAGTPTSSFTGASDISNFSFDVTGSLPHTSPGSTVSVSNFEYSLNNVPVSVPVSSVTFYNVASSGLFDISFSNGASVSLYGANIGNIDTTWVIGPPGYYTATAAYDDGSATGNGGVVLTVSAVPLPAALPLFGAALAGIAGLGVRKKESFKAA